MSGMPHAPSRGISLLFLQQQLITARAVRQWYLSYKTDFLGELPSGFDTVD
jgi:hypothetical protein